MPLPIAGQTVEALRRSTVLILTGNGRRGGSGSGVALPGDRILTNAHVISASDVMVESWEGKTARAEVIRLDRRKDLALLHAPALAAPAASFADSDTVQAGTPVVAVGNPLGFKGAVSTGTVHALYADQGRRWICCDLRLAPGNSGGPLADWAGRVLGINTMVVMARGSSNLSLAIPSRVAQAFLSAGRQARLGVMLRPVKTGASQQFGLLVLEVNAGEPADRASLLPGDILTGANGRTFRGVEDLEDALSGLTGSTLTLHFERGGERKERRVTVYMPGSPAATAA